MANKEKLMKLYLTEKDLRALENVVTFVRPHVQDGLAVYIDKEPMNAETEEEEATLHGQQEYLQHSVERILSNAVAHINTPAPPYLPNICVVCGAYEYDVHECQRCNKDKSVSSERTLAEAIATIKDWNDVEYQKLVDLHTFLTSSEGAMADLGKGKDHFILGYADHIIRFYDSAQMYGSMVDLLETVICDY